MRPTDIVTQVEEGRCHLGVTGMDVFAERAAEADAARSWSSPTSATAAAGWSSPCPRAGSTSTHVIDLVDLTAEFKDAGPDLPGLDQVPRA